MCAWSVVADDERREREALLSEFVAGGAFCSVCAWCGALVARPLLAAHYGQHKAAAVEALARQEELSRRGVQERFLASLAAWLPPGMAESAAAAHARQAVRSVSHQEGGL